MLIEQIHNHKLPRTHVSVSGKIYNRYRYVEEMREALEKYASYVERQCPRGQVGSELSLTNACR